jgi:hypothetical protein
LHPRLAPGKCDKLLAVKITHISFGLLLPIIELTIWTILVPSYSGSLYYRLRQASRGSEQVNIRSGEMEMRLRKDRWLSFAIASLPPRRARAVVASNLPGVLPEVLVSLLTPQPGKWHPSAISLDAWRAHTLPFYCLPFWWLAGLGLDGLLWKRRLHWAALSVAVVLFLIFAVLLSAYFITAPRDESDLRWLMPGVGLWTALFGLVSLNWLRRKSDGAIGRTRVSQTGASLE